MTCPKNDVSSSAASSDKICFPGTYDSNSPWSFYNHLIEGVPDDIYVKDYCLGVHWTYVEAECGAGVSFTTRNGGKRTFSEDLCGKTLREVAELSKSWCFEEASLGVAALNAWYCRAELLEPLGVVYDEPQAHDGIGRRGGFTSHDAFDLYRPRIEALSAAREKTPDEATSRTRAHVTVVGHFPHVERIEEYADLTVLERVCRDGLDTPDPACEYVLPTTDFAFVTGVTIINKTAPRLLDLSRNAACVFVGPSVVMSPYLFDCGVEMLAGSIVGDIEKLKFAVKNGAGKLFGEALQMASLIKK